MATRGSQCITPRMYQLQERTEKKKGELLSQRTLWLHPIKNKKEVLQAAAALRHRGFKNFGRTCGKTSEYTEVALLDGVSRL